MTTAFDRWTRHQTLERESYETMARLREEMDETTGDDAIARVYRRAVDRWLRRSLVATAARRAFYATPEGAAVAARYLADQAEDVPF